MIHENFRSTAEILSDAKDAPVVSSYGCARSLRGSILQMRIQGEASCLRWQLMLPVLESSDLQKPHLILSAALRFTISGADCYIKPKV